jgi:hypothetical protein
MHQLTSDLRIRATKPLLAPAILEEELPLDDARAELVSRSRRAIEAIIAGADDRLLVVVGPCSIHDPAAAVEYAGAVARRGGQYPDDLLLVMRVYFEKPRTVIGWKGLINDPGLDGSFQINKGLRLARKLMLDVTGLGLPVATEFLDTILGQYYADLVSWGAIGARTVESQVHRELASGLSMPVGFKNRTDGNVQVAVDAIARRGTALVPLAHARRRAGRPRHGGQRQGPPRAAGRRATARIAAPNTCAPPPPCCAQRAAALPARRLQPRQQRQGRRAPARRRRRSRRANRRRRTRHLRRDAREQPPRRRAGLSDAPARLRPQRHRCLPRSRGSRQFQN